ncbi:MAG: hypothetical protein U0905_01815 [Pirellulales bacterium]
MAIEHLPQSWEVAEEISRNNAINRHLLVIKKSLSRIEAIKRKQAEYQKRYSSEPASPLGIERQMLEAGGKALASPFNEAGKMLEPAMSKVSKAMELSKAIPNDEGANS